MLARAANPDRGNTEIQDDIILGQQFGAWNRTLSFNVQLIGESLDQNEGSTDGAVLDHDQPRNKSKGKREAANRPEFSSKRA